LSCLVYDTLVWLVHSLDWELRCRLTTTAFQWLHVLVDVQVDLKGLEILLELVCSRPVAGAAPGWLFNDLRAACEVDALVSACLTVCLAAAGTWLLTLTYGLVSSSKRLVCHFRARICIRWMELLRCSIPLKRQFCASQVYGRGVLMADSSARTLAFVNDLLLRQARTRRIDFAVAHQIQVDFAVLHLSAMAHQRACVRRPD